MVDGLHVDVGTANVAMTGMHVLTRTIHVVGRATVSSCLLLPPSGVVTFVARCYTIFPEGSAGVGLPAWCSSVSQRCGRVAKMTGTTAPLALAFSVHSGVDIVIRIRSVVVTDALTFVVGVVVAVFAVGRLVVALEVVYLLIRASNNVRSPFAAPSRELDTVVAFP